MKNPFERFFRDTKAGKAVALAGALTAAVEGVQAQAPAVTNPSEPKAEPIEAYTGDKGAGVSFKVTRDSAGNVVIPGDYQQIKVSNPGGDTKVVNLDGNRLGMTDEEYREAMQQPGATSPEETAKMMGWSQTSNGETTMEPLSTDQQRFVDANANLANNPPGTSGHEAALQEFNKAKIIWEQDAEKK
jgi:hypothetical protein